MTCAHLQCDRPRLAIGLCRAHNARLIKGQSIAHPIRCQATGCERDSNLEHGYCRAHAWRIKRHGSPLAHIPFAQVERKPAIECTVTGCTATAKTKGLCPRHDARRRRTGSVHLQPRIGPLTHASGLTTRQIEAGLHQGVTLAQIADSHLIHPRALRLWLERIGRDDLLRKAS